MDHILVIDDSRAQAEYLKSILKKDYEVTTCQKGEDGLNLAKTGHFSLIFLDIIMPEMDGFTLLRRLQETRMYSMRSGVSLWERWTTSPSPSAPSP